MGEVTIKYTLPEEERNFKLAINASAMYSILWDLDQWLRSEIKYREQDVLQPARDKLYELMEEHTFNINGIE